jgi:hypothetical protein
LPALILMPATSMQTMLMIDVPLCLGTTGSLAAFYMMAEHAQGRKRREALKTLPMILALGAGLAPHLTTAVWSGLTSMAGEFVRTPKHGVGHSMRYRMRADLPFAEMFLSVFSFASVVASVQTGHWIATPFASLFCFGYGYVAIMLSNEQAARRRAATLALTTAPDSAPASMAPVAQASSEELAA